MFLSARLALVESIPASGTPCVERRTQGFIDMETPYLGLLEQILEEENQGRLSDGDT